MCTVTFVPKKDGFVFASNRDEQPLRKTILPKYYQETGVELFFPKDEVAGGTWIGLSSHERLVCLLNGGKVYHNPKIKFPKSRGVIVTQMLTAKDVLKSLKEVDLEGVAPFTLVVVDWRGSRKVYELIWCRNQKFLRELSVNEKHIWSSSTLYTEEMKAERKEWFANLDGDAESVLAFHQNEVLGTVETSPKMKRDVVETVSTTLIEKTADNLCLEYHDYVQDETNNYSRIFNKVNV